MYVVVFPILAAQTGPSEYCLPAALARDVLAQHRFQSNLHIICHDASRLEKIPSPQKIALEDHPGLKITILPHTGRRSLLIKLPSIVRILRSAAAEAESWHSGCATELVDLTTISFLVGRYFARGLRILCLDSDPASMVAKGTRLQRWKAPFLRLRYRSWANEVDCTIFVGAGAEDVYARSSRRSLTTAAVWLDEGDAASIDEIAKKFNCTDPVRLALPSRLTSWKGVDDVLHAFRRLDSGINYRLDIIGAGPEIDRLRSIANGLEKILFLGEIPYGDQFYSALRSYHAVIIPTRGNEEPRIAYDAAASGCAIIHSDTRSLNGALSAIEQRWKFEPGNTDSLANVISQFFVERHCWELAALQGRSAIAGRTIQDMHRARKTFLDAIRQQKAREATAHKWR
jgi:glycosyltransferase involved in cell wall biosynthesis